MARLPEMDEYICGGYFITKVIARPEGMSPGILPDHIVSLSSCEWVRQHFDVYDVEYPGAFPGVFPSFDSAREFFTRLLAGSPELLILGIGLYGDYVADFLDFLDKENSFPGARDCGVWQAVNQRNNPAPGGTILGFEVLGYEHGGFHSWLCNDLQSNANREFGIQPGDLGLLCTFDEAKQVAEYAARDDVGAEPALWMPWLIVQYMPLPNASK